MAPEENMDIALAAYARFNAGDRVAGLLARGWRAEALAAIGLTD